MKITRNKIEFNPGINGGAPTGENSFVKFADIATQTVDLTKILTNFDKNVENCQIVTDTSIDQSTETVADELQQQQQQSLKIEQISNNGHCIVDSDPNSTINYLQTLPNVTVNQTNDTGQIEQVQVQSIEQPDQYLKSNTREISDMHANSSTDISTDMPSLSLKTQNSSNESNENELMVTRSTETITASPSIKNQMDTISTTDENDRAKVATDAVNGPANDLYV